MTASKKTFDVTVQRTIPAPPSEVFDAWLDPEIPGTLWHGHEKVILKPEIDGLWYVLSRAHRREGTPHYGRFIEMTRPSRIQHSWMSRNTLGEETLVTVTFQKRGEDTLLTILHSGFPSSDTVTPHEKGWNTVLGKFSDTFVSGSLRRH